MPFDNGLIFFVCTLPQYCTKAKATSEIEAESKHTTVGMRRLYLKQNNILYSDWNIPDFWEAEQNNFITANAIFFKGSILILNFVKHASTVNNIIDGISMRILNKVKKIYTCRFHGSKAIIENYIEDDSTFSSLLFNKFCKNMKEINGEHFSTFHI